MTAPAASRFACGKTANRKASSFPNRKRVRFTTEAKREIDFYVYRPLPSNHALKLSLERVCTHGARCARAIIDHTRLVRTERTLSALALGGCRRQRRIAHGWSATAGRRGELVTSLRAARQNVVDQARHR